MTKAIELFEELLSSKLNLKITLLIKREVLKENTWSGMLQAYLQLSRDFETKWHCMSPPNNYFLEKEDHHTRTKLNDVGVKPSVNFVLPVAGAFLTYKMGSKNISSNSKVSENISGLQKPFLLLEMRCWKIFLSAKIQSARGERENLFLENHSWEQVQS